MASWNASKSTTITSKFGEREWSTIEGGGNWNLKTSIRKGHHNHQHAMELQDHLLTKNQN
jgi:hypothetical protein